MRRLAAFGVCLLLTACGDSSQPAPASDASTAPPFVGEDWPMYGHDTARSGYSSAETRITAGNVGQLVERFRLDIGFGAMPSSSGPLVVGGKLYVGSSVATGDNYFCFDALTGARIWSANVGHSPPFPGNVGIGSTAAIVDGILVVGGGDPAYYGLEAATGARLWRHDMAVGAEAFAWSSPLVADGIAYVGISSRYAAVRGELRALDFRTGLLLARQYFVPAGHLGADIWNSASLSPDAASVAVATGNDYGGRDSALTRSIVALDPTTLAVQASHQVAAFNQDLDFGTTPVFFSDAAGRSLVGANEKDGRFFAYDATRIDAGPVWVKATGLAVGAMPAYDPRLGSGGTLFIVGDNGVLYGVDPATGADRWPPLVAGFANGGVAVANGLVFMGFGSGVLGIVDGASGTILRSIVPPSTGQAFSGPIVAHGIVYWMAGPWLNAWSLP
jgi:outer membrane protein assembly factor BamB